MTTIEDIENRPTPKRHEPDSPEHRAANALSAKGMDYYDAGILGFDLVNATGFIELAEDSLRHAIERREELIVAAKNAGLSYRTIAKYVGLSHQRVAQIIESRRSA